MIDVTDPRVIEIVLAEAAKLEGDSEGYLTNNDIEYLEHVAEEAIAEFSREDEQ